MIVVCIIYKIMSDKTDFDYSLMRKFEYSHYLF